MSNLNKFQNRIIDLANDVSYKKSELPKIMGVDYRSLSNAINYGIIPTPKILIRIADFFNISINYLLARTDIDDFDKSKVPSNFHTRLKELIDEKNVTYYKVSSDCHFNKSYISRWFNKNYMPSLELLDLLADYFKVNLDYLLGRTDYRPKD